MTQTSAGMMSMARSLGSQTRPLAPLQSKADSQFPRVQPAPRCVWTAAQHLQPVLALPARLTHRRRGTQLATCGRYVCGSRAGARLHRLAPLLLLCSTSARSRGSSGCGAGAGRAAPGPASRSNATRCTGRLRGCGRVNCSLSCRSSSRCRTHAASQAGILLVDVVRLQQNVPDNEPFVTAGYNRRGARPPVTLSGS